MLTRLLLATYIVTAMIMGGSCAVVDMAPATSDTPKGVLDQGRIDQLINAKVVQVIDAMVIDVDIDGELVRVRYLGIDIAKGDLTDEDELEFNDSALDFNRLLVEGKTVELETDAIETDFEGNLLAYVYVDDDLVNKELITSGYASVANFPATFKYQTEFLITEYKYKQTLNDLWRPASLVEKSPSLEIQSSTTNVPRFWGGTLPRPPSITDTYENCDYSGTKTPIIKGTIDTQTGERVYHLPGGFFYNNTRVDKTRGDVWFCSEGEAIAAGWRRFKR